VRTNKGITPIEQPEISRKIKKTGGLPDAQREIFLFFLGSHLSNRDTTRQR
jgi:hypothetical protein